MGADIFVVWMPLMQKKEKKLLHLLQYFSLFYTHTDLDLTLEFLVKQYQC